MVKPKDDGAPHALRPPLQLMDTPECKRWLTSGSVDPGVIGWLSAKHYHIPIVITENRWGILLQMAFPAELCPPFTEGNFYLDMPMMGTSKQELELTMQTSGENYSDLAYGNWRMYVLEHVLDPASPLHVPKFEKHTLRTAASSGQ